MKTKNTILKSIGAGAAAVLLFVGCSLEEFNPSGGPTIEEYYSTPTGFGELINGCYFPLTRSWTGGGEDQVVYWAEAGTDLWTGPKGDGYLMQCFYYTGLNGGTSSVDEGWQSSYETINYCNLAINFAANAGFRTEPERDAKVAEAYFLRAFFNFFIVEQFGPCYLSETYTTEPKLNIPRATVEEYYDLIFRDCKFAIQHLPKVQSDRGRATRAAALHLYAKACLQYAGYAEATNKQELYTEAKNAAEEIIKNLASYQLALYNTPGEVFTSANNKANTEAVWVATHSSNGSLNPRGGNYWNRVYKQFGCQDVDGQCGLKYDIESEFVKMERRIMPTLALLDLYGAKDTRYAAYFREDYIANTQYSWSEGDALKFKKPESFVGNVNIYPGELAMHFTRGVVADATDKPYACLDRNMIYKADGSANIDITMNAGYVALKKFEKPGMYWGELGKSYTWADHYVYRLAETYLLAAEACWRLNDANAVTYFNVIRNRACEGHDGSLNIVASDIDVDFVLAERARELCGEYTRFMDLKRMGKDVMKRYVESNPDIRNRGAFNINTHWVRPIPEKSELNFSQNPADFQNPGY